MFVLVWQGKNLFLPLDGGAYDAVFLDHVQATPFTSDPKSVVIFLGVHTHAYVSSFLRARACALLPTHASHSWFMLMQSQKPPTETQSLFCFKNARDPKLQNYEGKRVFGLDVSHLESVTIPSADPPTSHGQKPAFEQLRSLGGLLTDDHDAGLLASARGPPPPPPLHPTFSLLPLSLTHTLTHSLYDYCSD